MNQLEALVAEIEELLEKNARRLDIFSVCWAFKSRYWYMHELLSIFSWFNGLITYEKFKATTRIIKYSARWFYNLLLLSTQTLIEIRKYYTNQYARINFIQREEDLQGNLLFRELVFNWLYSLASLLPLLDHNPSCPGVGRPPPQRPGLQDNEKLGVAWVIYRIIM